MENREIQPPKIHLLMWVYRGGPLWHRALRNALEYRPNFDSFVVSFNGPNRGTLKDEINDCAWQELAPRVLVAPGDLDALDHSIWVAESTAIQSLPDDDLLLLLAEDDIVNWSTMLPALSAARSLPGPFVFGRWRNAHDHQPSGFSTQLEVYSGRATQCECLIGRRRPGSEPVSISGLVLTAETFRRAHEVMKISSRSRSLLSGARTEYFFATQATVKSLLRSGDPVAFITRHAEQGSLAIKRSDWQQSEALFQLWLVASRYPNNTLIWFLTFYRLFRSLFQSPRTLIYLPRSYRHFLNIASR